eukprot:GFKZ01015241.1.p2 GENE.GFKZ01015241.1~~GFKZ01015241.1.p2  ORF type:complete len:103 (+),score=5.28 GFKZ01015241.1:792-1100(+)
MLGSPASLRASARERAGGWRRRDKVVQVRDGPSGDEAGVASPRFVRPGLGHGSVRRRHTRDEEEREKRERDRQTDREGLYYVQLVYGMCLHASNSLLVTLSV